MNNPPKTRTSAQRYNSRMERIWREARRIEKERVARGEKPNPNLTPMKLDGKTNAELLALQAQIDAHPASKNC